MRRRRVKITGIGPVTPAGIGRTAFWTGMQQSCSRAVAISRFREEAGSFVAAEVSDFHFENYVNGGSAKRTPRHTQFAIASSLLALKDAGLDQRDLVRKKVAVYVGAALMDFGTINKSVEIILRRGPVNGLPTSISSGATSAIAGAICDLIGCNKISGMTFQSACCSGLDAIGHAFQSIRSGEFDIAICGGTEAPIYFHPMLELKMAGLAPGNAERPQAQCRPFDLWRTTGVIGEGSCMFILEPDSSPRPALAYIEGYAFSADQNNQLCSGLNAAIRLTLADSNTSYRNIESISAWGPGHRELDKAEAEALVDIFANTLTSIPISSIKGAIGNPLGAAGAMQVAAAALGIHHGQITPTVNWEHPDPDCDLRLSSAIRDISHKNSLINSHGISGSNACLLISR